MKLAALLLGLLAQGAPAPTDAALEARFAQLETRIGGRIGFLAVDLQTGRTVSHRADERFAMCSTFKFLLSADVLAQGGLSLARRIPYAKQDLLEYAPITTAHVKDGSMSVQALLEAALEQSDNTAANLLLPLVGGPAGLTAWLRARGDTVTRLDRNEPTLNENREGDPRDTTTPAAMVADLRRFLEGNALSPAARARLRETMEQCTTCSHRLRAGFPSGWKVADKTGTGQRGTVQDVALGWDDHGHRVAMALYTSGATLKTGELEAVHAELARAALSSLGLLGRP